MSSYKIEIIWQFDNEYMITILSKNNKEIAKYNHKINETKEEI